MELSEYLPVLVGILISLIFSYFPGVQSWYDWHTGDQKRVIMLAALLTVGVVYFLLSCTAWAARLGIVVACTTDGAYLVLVAFTNAIIANQTTHLLTPSKAKG